MLTLSHNSPSLTGLVRSVGDSGQYALGRFALSAAVRRGDDVGLVVNRATAKVAAGLRLERDLMGELVDGCRDTTDDSTLPGFVKVRELQLRG